MFSAGLIPAKGSSMLTKAQFETLTPFDRGYIVYLCGNKKDQPCIPNEQNPYDETSSEYIQWNRGQHQAVTEAQGNPQL